jgi:basic membrane protein A
MKIARRLRNPRLAFLVAAMIVPAVLVACGGDDDDGTADAGTTTDTAAETAETTEPAAQDYSVALIGTGARNNQSWMNSWVDGAERAAEELGVSVEIADNADAPDQYLTQCSAFASQGVDLIIFAFGAAVEQAAQCAEQFPDTYVVDVFQPPDEDFVAAEPPNVGHVDPEQQQGTFLAGVLAGLVTETNTIGSVYAFPFPALNRQFEAYELGARCVNPDIEALVRQSDSFTDAAAARAAASALIDNDADVLLAAVDQAVQGLVQAASEAQEEGKQVFVFPSYFDANDLGPEVVLSSVLYNLDGVAYDIIEKGLNGELGDNYFQSYTFENLQVGDLAPLGEQEELVGENIAILDAFKAAIADGTITIPDETISDPDVAGGATIGEVGSAANIDAADLGCTDEFRAELGL